MIIGQKFQVSHLLHMGNIQYVMFMLNGAGIILWNKFVFKE